MKKTIAVFAPLLFAWAGGVMHAYGQGTKISEFPLAAAADANTTLAGVQYSGGTYANKRYSLAQLTSYINGVLNFHQVLGNGNTTSRTARFLDGSSNLTEISPGLIQLSGGGYHAAFYPGTLYIYNNIGAYGWLGPGAVALSNTTGSAVSTYRSPTLTGNRTYRGTDSNGTVALYEYLHYASSTLDSGKIYVGNASNMATAVTASGDATISNTGVIVVDSFKFTTNERVQKLVDSLGDVLTTIGADILFVSDSFNYSTRAWRQKGIDSLISILNTIAPNVVLISDSFNYSTRAWRQKGIDSLNDVIAGMTSAIVASIDVTGKILIGDTTIIHYLVPADGVYLLSGYCQVTAISSATFNLAYSFTTPDASTNNGVLNLGGTFSAVSTTTFGAYQPVCIIAKAGTYIDMKASTSGAFINYNAGARITQQ